MDAPGWACRSRLALTIAALLVGCTFVEGPLRGETPAALLRVAPAAQPIALTGDHAGRPSATRALEERVEHALVTAGVRVVTRDRLSVADEEAQRQRSPRYANESAVELGRLLGARSVGIVTVDDLRVDTRIHVLTHHHYGTLSASLVLIDIETGEIVQSRRASVRVDRRAREVTRREVEELLLTAGAAELVGVRPPD